MNMEKEITRRYWLVSTFEKYGNPVSICIFTLFIPAGEHQSKKRSSKQNENVKQITKQTIINQSFGNLLKD